MEIRASDIDTVAPYNVISFELIADDAALQFFKLESTGANTAMIRVRSLLNVSSETLYKPWIKVTNPVDIQCSASTTAEIFVNRNLNGPEFVPGQYNATIPETLQKDGTVLTVLALDSDRISPFNTVTYELSTVAFSPNALDYFNINEQNGIITVDQPAYLDMSDVPQYEVGLTIFITQQPLFPMFLAITNFLVSYTCEIRFHDVIDRTVFLFTT